MGPGLLDKIKTVTNKPVTTIINTHAHEESTGGNEFFPTSVEIVAQENTRLRMDKMDAYQGAKVNFLPKLMFRDKMTIGSGKDRIDLAYFGRGHTGGDAWVHFPGLRVLLAGDLLAARQLPVIDFDSGGSGLSYPDTLGKAAAAIKNVDTIVPSHGSVLTTRTRGAHAVQQGLCSAVVLAITTASASAKSRRVGRCRTVSWLFGSTDRVTANVRMIFAELARYGTNPVEDAERRVEQGDRRRDYCSDGVESARDRARWHIGAGLDAPPFAFHADIFIAPAGFARRPHRQLRTSILTR